MDTCRYLQVPERQGIVKQPEAPPRAVELRSGRQHILKGHEVWLVKLDGITSREQAAELRGFRYRTTITVCKILWPC
jgi:hypothetical protein